jgi:L-seryl-tRNA(Ser) seleniumtransferase
MARALRVDKLTLAALEATLQSYRRGRAPDEIPVWRMIAASVATLAARAAGWQERLAARGHCGRSLARGERRGRRQSAGRNAAHACAGRARGAGGRGCAAGTAPGHRLPHAAGSLLFDPRTILPEQEEYMLTALADAVKMNNKIES